ncbi:MAG: VTT domain-containing protein [Burkholderiales bacterium]
MQPAARARLARLVILLAFAGAIGAFFALGGHRYLTLDTIKRHRDLLLAFTEAHYVQALAIAFVTYTAAVAFSIPGAVLLSLVVGFVFGRWAGTLLVLFAATLGAALLFLAARYVFADAARRRLGPAGRRINEGFTRNAWSYLLFLRLVPAFPFFLVNIAVAFSSVPLSTFVAATFVGIIPGTFVFVNLGETLSRIDSLQGLLSLPALGAFALLGVLALVPVAVRRWRGKGRGARERRRVSKRRWLAMRE